AFLAVGLGDRATSHFERSSELRQAALGELHEDTARALYYEAVVAPTLRQQISKLRRSIEIETRLERPSSNFPYALIDGAWRLMLAGQIEEASSWLERGRAIVERSFPDAHPLRNLIVLRDLEMAILTGRLELTESLPELVASADASFAKTTEIQRGEIEGYRARSALLRGQIEDAILLFRSALARESKITENAQSFAAQRWRALLVQALLLSEAADEAEREAEILKPGDDLGNGSYYDVPALLARASLYHARGDLPGCEGCARKAMALLRREVVHPNLITAQAQTVLGECLLAGGDSAGAAEILEDSHRLLAEILGPENWEVRRVERLVTSTRHARSDDPLQIPVPAGPVEAEEQESHLVSSRVNQDSKWRSAIEAGRRPSWQHSPGQ
ncbi:MAG: tetratricopeptide repeat protein, partial [bacterium]|nr:tetratricopeptide repeat protein [bacterium]